MGSLLKNVLKVASPIASIAANFVPGGSVISKILGATGTVGNIVGGLDAQGQAQSKANQYAGQIGGVASALGQLGGIDPATGKFDPNFNPNAASAETMFNPAQLTGNILANREAQDARADNLVSSNVADALGRGFGTNDSALTAANADARTQAEAANNGYTRQLYSNLLQQKNAFLQDGLQSRQNALQASLGSLGGLQGMYASEAGQIGSGINAAVGGLAKTGFDLSSVGDYFKAKLGIGKRKQSTSLGTTGANSPSPIMTAAAARRNFQTPQVD